MSKLHIKLIVTGDMEKSSLHTSLKKHFPGNKNGQEVIWDEPRKLHCATSRPLEENKSPSQPMQDLAQAMISEALTGKTGTPADLVLVIDDVELANFGREGIIASHFKAAVHTVLNKSNHSNPTHQRLKNIREKCSFHLFRTMTENYFFGDVTALNHAGVPTHVSPKLVHSTDVEQFESNDGYWLPSCHQINKQKNLSWWREECHPKHYLEHLTQRAQTSYSETKQGKAALENLNWPGVPKGGTDTPMIRSLFEDIADWFGIPNPIGTGTTNPDFFPTPSVNRQTRLLRNM